MSDPRSAAAPPLHLPYPGAPLSVALSRAFRKAFVFSGRASLSEFWKVHLLGYSYSVAVQILAITVNREFFTTLFLLSAVVMIMPSLSVAVRRLHDANFSGGLYFLLLIPFAGPIIQLVLFTRPSNPAGARFDATQHPVAPVSHARTGAPASVPPPPPPTTPPVATPAPVPLSAAIVSAPALIGGLGEARVTPPPAVHEDLDATRITPTAPQPVVCHLTLSDGQQFALGPGIVIGRDPIAHEGDRAIRVDDPNHSLSKTHAQFHVQADRLWVTDLHSTNGTAVCSPAGDHTICVPGAAMALEVGSTVQAGDITVTVQAAL